MKKLLILIAMGISMSSCYYRVQGAKGENGTNGVNGTNGESCNVQQLSNGALIQCPTSSAAVSNGTDASLPAGMLYIKEVVNPCGTNFANEEVFLRLSDNKLIALYDGGNNLSRLTLLGTGNYITTDSSNHYCSFTVDNNYQLTNQVVH